MLDPELIDNVNVNLGSTDVDSPTASATGSTVNYRSRDPSKDFHARLLGSAGDFGFMRIFGVVDTGNLTKDGLRAWLSASSSTNNMFSGGVGQIDKKQYNFKIVQPLGDNGDYITLAGHWNRNRNNMSPSIYLINENYGTKSVGSANSNRYPTNWSEAYYNVGTCTTPSGITGTADKAGTCGTLWEYRYNPSDTGNLRMNMRFTLSDKLLLTIDPSVQYVKANGGGTVTGREGVAMVGGQPYTGFINGVYWFGRDLNRDGDTADTCISTATGACANTTPAQKAVNGAGVTLLAPSQTQTWRLGVNASLRYAINEQNSLRINYTYDRGRHHQTGELGYLTPNGFGATPFPVDSPILDASGNPIEKRNRLSYAILHQVSGEYAGRLLDNRLDVVLGLRAPFLRRDLTNYCFTTSSAGYVDCLGNASMNAAYAAFSPSYSAPQTRVIDYNRVLPNAGFTFKLMPAMSIFANYAKGFQVPGTDNLYNAFYFAANTEQARPAPETTDNFDVGVRYRSGKVMAQLSGWYTLFHNRLASAYDQDLQATIYRNLGTVKKYGFDANVSYAPNKNIAVYGFVSLLKSHIDANVDAGKCATASNLAALAVGGLVCTGTEAYDQTAGKRESAAPVSTMGAKLEGHVSLFDLSATVKRTGERYVNDQNLPFYVGTTKVFEATAPAYTTVDLMARANLTALGAPKNTYFQMNVINLFNTLYVGGFAGTSAAYFASYPSTTAYLPLPRTITGSVSVAF